MKGLITKLDSLFFGQVGWKKAFSIKYYLPRLVFEGHSNYNELLNRIVDTAVKIRDVL